LTCGTGAAFSTDGSSAILTPTFTLPTGVVKLNSGAHGTLPPAGSAVCNSAFAQLNSGVGLTLPLQQWDYCYDVTNAPAAGIASFTISWSQG
jgi:hypothetical protein